MAEQFQMTSSVLTDIALNPGCKDESIPRWVIEAERSGAFSPTGPRHDIGFQIGPFDRSRRDEPAPYRAGDWLVREASGQISARHD